MIYGQTVLHPLALVFTLIAGVFIFALPRRYSFVPLIITGIFISMQQRLVIAGLDFMMLRLLILAGLTRLILRSDHEAIKLNNIDKAIICYVIVQTITYFFLWQTTGALLNRLGGALDALGLYFFFRFTVQTFEDINRLVKSFVIVCLILAAVMLVEWSTGRNSFSIFGGVPEMTMVRGGRLRCQGAFLHPIMAGTFGASLFPIFLYRLIYSANNKISTFLGILATLIITFTSSSSGPAITLSVGLLGLALWSFRMHIRKIIWASIFMLIGLHIFMKAPVWALLGRAHVLGSSTSYHRYLLFDEFIHRFNEWWLIGTKSTSHWGHFGMNLWDVTNNYVQIAVDGGLISLICFILIIYFSFKSLIVGLEINTNDIKFQMLIWSLGVSLFAHVVSFMGVSYFDQIIVLWYALICMISTIHNNMQKSDEVV